MREEVQNTYMVAVSSDLGFLERKKKGQTMIRTVKRSRNMLGTEQLRAQGQTNKQ